MIESASAIIFTVFTGIVVLFQGCLAAGAPWGAASMGGKYPGKYPPRMRIIAALNILILSLLAAIVLAEAGLLFSLLKPISSVGIWIVVVFYTFGTIMNTITPSKIERIWAPVALVQLITSIIVAVS